MTEDDDDIQDYVASTGWRKRQVAELNEEFDRLYAIHKRNEVLEEVAKEFDKMPFGDTAASFAIFVRNMKK
jgi:L-ribulose-5-phosphate 3-epimerase UlaE